MNKWMKSVYWLHLKALFVITSKTEAVIFFSTMNAISATGTPDIAIHSCMYNEFYCVRSDWHFEQDVTKSA